MRLLALVGCVVISSCKSPPEQKAQPATTPPVETKARKRVAHEKAWKPTYKEPDVSSNVTKVETLISKLPPMPVNDKAPDVAAPFSLTAADGSGLMVTRIDAKAVVEGPIAFTEMHLYFQNPEDRTREGTFAMALPKSAAVSRFAMEIGGKLVEAEVVEKQRARRAYEDFLHRRQDPALLEKAAGNEFTARVFPIAPNAEKHLVISFSQEVSPGHYTLPLRGLAKSDHVDVRVQVRGKDGLYEQTFSKKDWKPDVDVVVDASAIGAPTSVAAGMYAVTRVKLDMPVPPMPPTALTLLIDTSASRAAGFATEVRRIQSLVDEVARTYGGELPIQVVAYDQETVPVYEGAAASLTDLEARLVKRGAYGASDLGQALAWVKAHAPKPRLVVITDGVVTAGAALDVLRATAKSLGDNGVQRLDVVASGGIRDEQTAGALAQAGLAVTGTVLDFDRGPVDVARRLGLAVKTDLDVKMSGAEWSTPHVISAAQPGDEITIYLRRSPLVGDLSVAIGGATTTLQPIGVPVPLLSRAVAGAEILELEGELAKATGDAAKKLRTEIGDKSIAARVVSSQTAMLVLESERDYETFGIDRTALADILAVGPAGVELVHRGKDAALIADSGKRTKRPVTESDDPDAPAAGEETNDVEDTKVAQADSDDVPPEEEDRPDDGEEESGGTGTAMALDEGKMGKKDSDRAEGQYKMRKSSSGEWDFLDDDSDEWSRPARPKKKKPLTPEEFAFEEKRQKAAAERRLRAEERRIIEERRAEERRKIEQQLEEARQKKENERRERMAKEPQCIDNPTTSGCPMPELTPVHDVDGNEQPPPLAGALADITSALARKSFEPALARAQAWHDRNPGDVLALIALGEVMEAKKDLAQAARIYGSIIDLYPARADFRRFAGERLERIGAAVRNLVIDTYQRAVAERPDHMTGHRLLAYALLRAGKLPEAFAAILAGIDQKYPDDRFKGGDRVLREDAGMIGAAYLAKSPDKRGEVVKELEKRDTKLATQPSTRFIMYWESDSNDVDFHIRDSARGHAFYSQPDLPSGGSLYADITTGYGPECFAIEGTPKAGPYRLSINYFSQGPMGYGMGLLQVQRFDGKGGLSFEDRPYVIMTDHAFVELGSFR